MGKQRKNTRKSKPAENGQIESFNGTMRNELLREVEFERMREARKELVKWREKYNNERPHSALNYEPPSSRRLPQRRRRRNCPLSASFCGDSSFF